MGLLDAFKKKKEGDLPPPPPPRTGGLPPLPTHDLEAPPAPAMPQAPAPKAIPEPIDLPDMAPLPEVPVVSAQDEASDYDAYFTDGPLALEDTREEEPEQPVMAPPKAKPTLVQDPTLERPAPAAKPTPQVKPIVRRTPEELFVSVGEYQDMRESLSTIQRSLEESEAMINRLSELKNAEEGLLDTWRGHLEDVEKKLSYVDQVIFEGE